MFVSWVGVVFSWRLASREQLQELDLSFNFANLRHLLGYGGFGDSSVAAAGCS